MLLFLTTAPDSSGVARWITPGGGVDDGESHTDAAARELFEETGLSGIVLGAAVWSHDFAVEWDSADHDTGHAVYYTAVVDRFDPTDAGWTDDERVDVLEHRWWSLSELLSTTDRYEPEQLINLIRRLLPSCSA